jgi:hypothetical protein
MLWESSVIRPAIFVLRYLGMLSESDYAFDRERDECLIRPLTPLYGHGFHVLFRAARVAWRMN